jgi:hypothetical protein
LKLILIDSKLEGTLIKLIKLIYYPFQPQPLFLFLSSWSIIQSQP